VKDVRIALGYWNTKAVRRVGAIGISQTALSSVLGGEVTQLRNLLGSRAAPPIGVSSAEFRNTPVVEPTPDELAEYSRNPRNAYGDWYEVYVHSVAEPICEELELDLRARVAIEYQSVVYVSQKIFDLVVSDGTRDKLGLELKYLHGDGSLVKPKALIDAIDFTQRPFDCIYVIDGPGWQMSKNVEYLERWWTFSSSVFLRRTFNSRFRGP
jgi:hypothetical protein